MAETTATVEAPSAEAPAIAEGGQDAGTEIREANQAIARPVRF